MSETRTHTHSLDTPAAPAPRAGRAAVASAISTSLEWYDFFIYSTAAALVFNTTFFATDSEVVAAVNSFATVAVGFIARPIGGGVLAGHFGDKFGRKPVLVAAVVLMAIATSLIGFVPTTEIMWLAPMILVTLRICQGLAVGGAQWGGGAVLLATENAPGEPARVLRKLRATRRPDRRGPRQRRVPGDHLDRRPGFVPVVGGLAHSVLDQSRDAARGIRDPSLPGGDPPSSRRSRKSSTRLRPCGVPPRSSKCCARTREPCSWLPARTRSASCSSTR